MRAAVHAQRAPGAELGTTETALEVHPTHAMRDGACSACRVRATWPRIEAPCGNTQNARTKGRGRSWIGLSEAEKIARRAAKLRGER